ncbi:alpha/beta fold hydrolase [Rhodococcus phenolicus]|uniref:alpha/beta fold hydrolase n=1 Tax=Rhodococcus phenolicus TaxID=263849 RepID=UPI00083204EB|nr:alpha/beta fold hydrolase [Rhodococcus phenolicus]
MRTDISDFAPATPRLEHVDVLIIGAGFSGIGLGYHLTTKQPDRSFAILDGRDAIGGTWDLFRFPGIRSDSDLHTFAFAFKPWTSDNAIADAGEILDYLHETISENGLARRIHLGHKVLRASFSREDDLWTVVVEHDGEQFEVTCRILFSAAGYYDYDSGYTPHFDGVEAFGGRIVHPQFWPDDFDYSGKKIVVIGSGATAVTMIPPLADRASHVTMLQRSPSFVLPFPRKDPIANGLRRLLPDRLAFRITRRLNIARLRLIYTSSRRHPHTVRRILRTLNKRMLPAGYAVDIHFEPRYQPWDQRLCVAPDGDLFKAISRGAASVVTDRIVRFTQHGILLESGTELEADIIVTATGLNLLPFGGISLSVDGEKIAVADRLAYNAMMLEGVPNFAFSIGYTNTSWTLKVDLVAEHLCRLLAHMDRHGYSAVTPVADGPVQARKPYFDLESGYMRRGRDLFPKRGSDGPWTVMHDFAFDRDRLAGRVDHPALRFTDGHSPTGSVPPRGERTGAPTVLAVHGRPTRVRIAGDAGNPPVLLLHGLARSLDDWSPQYSRLSRHYRVIGLDLPGFGYSARIPEPSNLDVLARGVLETLDVLGEHRPTHVVGNSLGGAVAQQIVVLAPERVASLVLVDSAGFGSEVTALIRMIAVPGLGRLASRDTTRLGALVVERSIFADPAFVTEERIDRALDIARRRDPSDMVFETVHALCGVRGADPGWRRELVAAVNRHPRPILVVWGDKDRILPAHHLAATPHLYPHAETHVFRGVGHMPQLECPDDFASVVSTFLDGVSVGEGPDRRASVPASDGPL